VECGADDYGRGVFIPAVVGVSIVMIIAKRKLEESLSPLNCVVQEAVN
jgi:hypothetical protein